MFEITTGKINKPIKTVIYGVEGIGKTTLATHFPSPVFIDTEEGTTRIDVARYPSPSSFEMMIGEINDFKKQASHQTLVIDSIDWAEKLAVESMCAENKVPNVESLGYGKGYVLTYQKMAKLLEKLNEIVDAGKHVVLIAHSVIRTSNKPDDEGAYDRYELKLKASKNADTSGMVKEWADLVLFCNYKTFVVDKDKTGKGKASGGIRTMYAERTTAFDAKNRFGLPAEMPMEYKQIEHLFTGQSVSVTQPKPEPAHLNEPVQTSPVPTPVQPVSKSEPELTVDSMWHETEYTPAELEEMEDLPQALVDLMKADNVKPSEIREQTSKFYPENTPLANYDPAFIQGALIASWDGLLKKIKERRELPF